MLKRVLFVIGVITAVLVPTDLLLARGHSNLHSYDGYPQAISRSYRASQSSTGSHYVRGYYRKNGTYVREHVAGNPGSGNHWHLNPDGTDTLTRPNGTQTTILPPGH